MRSIRLDAYEFDSACSEQALELDISCRLTEQHADVAAFIADGSAGASAAVLNAPPLSLADFSRCAMVCQHLEQHAQIAVSEPCDWLVYPLEELDWNDVELLLIGPAHFIRYHWSTSA